MKKKILPFTLIATSILTTVPVVTACKKENEDTGFKPAYAYWNYTKDGKYVYPITPLPEQTVESKETLTDIYINNSYENTEIVAQDILSTCADGAQEYIDDDALLRGSVEVNVYEMNLDNQTISYDVNMFMQIKFPYEEEAIVSIGLLHFVKIPCLILPREEQNQTQYDLTVKTLEPDFWSNNTDWEADMIMCGDQLSTYAYYNYENCLDESSPGELDENLEYILADIFGVSNIQYLKNITVSEN